MWSSYSVCTRTSNDPIIVAFEYGSLAFVYGLLRTCAFKYESLVFVYGLQVEVVLRKSYSVAQDTILIPDVCIQVRIIGIRVRITSRGRIAEVVLGCSGHYIDPDSSHFY